MPIDLQRRQRVLHAMDGSGVDALLLWQPHEVVMASGFQPYIGATLLLVTRNLPSIAFAPVGEPPQAIEGCEMSSHRVFNGADEDAWRALRHDILDRLPAQSVSLQIGVSRLIGRGVPGGFSAESLGLNYELLVEHLVSPDLRLIDFTSQMSKLTLRKTATEVARIRVANEVAKLGINAFEAALRPGVREIDVALRVEEAVRTRIDEQGVLGANAWACIQSGDTTIDAGTFARSSGRTIQAGDMAVMELATCVNGYWSDLTRIAWAGPRNPRQENGLAILEEAQQAAVATLRIGNRHSDADMAARTILRKYEVERFFPHALGHHVGFRYHDPGPLLGPTSDATFEEGMIVTVEPGIYGRDLSFGMRTEDNYVITLNEPQRISL